MKRKFLCFGVLIMLFGSVMAEEFNGNVKSVKETSYNVTEKFGEVIKGKVFNTYVWRYDDKKRLVEEPYEEGKRLYKYDANGNKTEQVTHDSTGNLESTIIWNYNAKGEKDNMEEYDTNRKLVAKTIWKYNDYGEVIDKSEFDEKGKQPLEREIFVYDKNRCLEHSLYARYERYEPVSEDTYKPIYHGIGNGEPKLVWRCVHTFDEKGNEIEALLLGPNKDTLEIRTEEYDIHGNNTGTYWQSGKGITNKFNKKGVLIETNVFAYPYIDYPECHYAHHDYWRNWRRTDFIYYASYKKTYSNEGKIQSISYGNFPGDQHVTFEYYDEKGNIMEILEGGSYCNWDYWELLYSEQKHKKLTARSDNKVGFDKKTEYSYTYDKHDNWIKRVAYYMEVNTLPVCTEIVEREIEYWK